MAKTTIGILYDFDKTLCTTDMQEYSFIKNLGMTSNEFWGEAAAITSKHEVEKILAYMCVMIKKCKEKGIPVKCCKSFFRANGKAVSMGETDGFCKIVVAAEPKDGEESAYEPGRILGCHLFGPHSADIVHEACAMINRRSTLQEFQYVIHAHPTLTEVIQSALHS